MSGQDDVIVGGRELDALLQTLPAKMEKNIMRGALRAGAKVFKAEVEQRIPVDSGALLASTRITSRARRGDVSASVKVGNKTAWYAHLVEFGTRSHTIAAKNAKALSFGGVTTKSVHHPGATKHPFMRPAADAAFTGAVKAVTEETRRRLTKAGLDASDTAPLDLEQ